MWNVQSIETERPAFTALYTNLMRHVASSPLSTVSQFQEFVFLLHTSSDFFLQNFLPTYYEIPSNAFGYYFIGQSSFQAFSTWLFFILDSFVQNILDFTVINSADRFGQAILDDCPPAKAKNVVWHCSLYTKPTDASMSVRIV